MTTGPYSLSTAWQRVAIIAASAFSPPTLVSRVQSENKNLVQKVCHISSLESDITRTYLLQYHTYKKKKLNLMKIYVVWSNLKILALCNVPSCRTNGWLTHDLGPHFEAFNIIWMKHINQYCCISRGASTQLGPRRKKKQYENMPNRKSNWKKFNDQRQFSSQKKCILHKFPQRISSL